MNRVSFFPSLLWVVASSLLCGPVAAHEIRPAIVSVSFAGTERYEIEISTNLEALLAGVSPVHADTNESPNAQTYNRLRAMPPTELRAQFRKYETEYLAGIVAEFDGKRVVPALTAVEVPAVGDMRLARISRVRVAGAMPVGARECRWA